MVIQELFFRKAVQRMWTQVQAQGYLLFSIKPDALQTELQLRGTTVCNEGKWSLHRVAVNVTFTVWSMKPARSSDDKELTA